MSLLNFAGFISFKIPPWASIICLNFSKAFPESRISSAILVPSPFFALPVISKSSPAKNKDFSFKSSGPFCFGSKTLIASINSKAGPTPLPMGSFASVKTTFKISLKYLPRYSNFLFNFNAFALFIFAVFP